MTNDELNTCCRNSCCQSGVLTNGEPCPTCRGSGFYDEQEQWGARTGSLDDSDRDESLALDSEAITLLQEQELSDRRADELYEIRRESMREG